MTINILVPHLKISGGLRAVFTYAHLLSKRGHTVLIYVRNISFLRRILGNVLGRGPQWLQDFDPTTIRVTDFTEHEVSRADILLMDSWTVAARGFTLPSRCGIPVHFIQHDERLYHGPEEKVAAVYRIPSEKIVISDWLKDILERDFSVSPPVLVTPVDDALFFPVPNLRKKGRVRILILHHPYAWKGTIEGLRISNELKRIDPRVEIVMFGVRDQNASSLCDEYHYNLPQEKLAELYSSCDIYLCPSWDEGLGMPSMEAMACGAALVTYDNGGSREYAVDGETAFVAQHRDELDLARKLSTAVSDTALRDRIAQAGVKKIKSLPQWDDQVTQLERICTKLCK